MGGVLIVGGIVLSYLCWITKKEYQYIEENNNKNAMWSESIIAKRNNIERKIINKEKLTKFEYFSFYGYVISQKVLKYCSYFGLALSFLGFILLIINSN